MHSSHVDAWRRSRDALARSADDDGGRLAFGYPVVCIGGALAHVELSLSEAFLPRSYDESFPAEPCSLDRWQAAVIDAAEPCLVIDTDTIIRAISLSGCDLLSLGVPANVVGRALLDGVLRLVDFTAARTELPAEEADKIPPLLALTSGRLARGLLRVQPLGGDATTVDAISTPLWQNGSVVGSLSFFSPV